MMEQDREGLCGPRWKRDSDRSAGRAGTTESKVTLGGRRVPIRRPRVRSRDGREMRLPSFAFAASRDPLDRHIMNAVACDSAFVFDPGVGLVLPGHCEERLDLRPSSRQFVRRLLE